MPRKNLTDPAVRSLSTSKVQEDFWDVHTPGLCLRVSGKTNRKTWMVRYRAEVGHRRQKLGTYPTMTLAKARAKASDWISRAASGDDPAVEREEQRTRDYTFGAMADDVLDAQVRRGDIRPSTERLRRLILENELRPAWGKRPASSVTRYEVTKLAEAIRDRGSPVFANRTIATIKVLYNEALRRGFPGVTENPAAGAKPFQEPRRKRYLNGGELAALWRALEAEDILTAAIFKLTALTGQRIGSVCSVRWSDIDDDEWVVPESEFKGKRPHLVHLSPEALEVLDGVREITGESTHVFPSRNGSKKPHVTATGPALQRIRRRAEIEVHWVAHDLRRSFRTIGVRAESEGGLGINPYTCDQVLGHKDTSLGTDRYEGEDVRYFAAQKRDALHAWGAWVREAVEAK